MSSHDKDPVACIKRQGGEEACLIAALLMADSLACVDPRLAVSPKPLKPISSSIIFSNRILSPKNPL